MTIWLVRSIQKLINLDKELLEKASERSKDRLILHIIKMENYIKDIQLKKLDTIQTLELIALVDEELDLHNNLK
jgi:hypothetical protein